jgi:hypothetical protein
MLDELEGQHGPLPVTWVAKTGGGGLHYYFRSPQEIRNSVAQLGPGLDIRGTGGYVVAPPSRHISSDFYAWVSGQAPGEVPLAIMPEWLLPASKPDAPVPPSSWRALVCNGVSEGARNQNITRLTGHLLRKYVDPLVTLELMTVWNAQRCQPPLSDAEVRTIVNSIAGREIRRRGGAHG